jgi:hypothetical protein
VRDGEQHQHPENPTTSVTTTLPKPILPPWLRKVVPEVLLRRRRRFTSNRLDSSFSGRSLESIFTEIYGRQLWGSDSTGRSAPGLYSGPGSHDPGIVDVYVHTVRGFISAHFPSGLTLVDLGCGDFNIGSRFVDLADSYIACDVVQDLVDRNSVAFPEVDFRRLDLTVDQLPIGDIAIVRQVFQHLSNADIQRALANLEKFRWVIVSEAVPASRFIPNRDKPTGPGIRAWAKSGVVLGDPPFSMRCTEAQELCSVPDRECVIVTTAYRNIGTKPGEERDS